MVSSLHECYCVSRRPCFESLLRFIMEHLVCVLLCGVVSAPVFLPISPTFPFHSHFLFLLCACGVIISAFTQSIMRPLSSSLTLRRHLDLHLYHLSPVRLERSKRADPLSLPSSTSNHSGTNLRPLHLNCLNAHHPDPPRHLLLLPPSPLHPPRLRTGNRSRNRRRRCERLFQNRARRA